MKTTRATTAFSLLLLFSTSTHAYTTSDSILTKLGWVYSPLDRSICRGFYVEPRLTQSNASILPPQLSKTSINASYGSFSTSGTIKLTGNVVVSQNGRLLKADQGILVRDPETGKVKTIDLYGHVEAYNPGRLVLGDHAHLTFPEQSGYVTHVTYRMLLSQRNIGQRLRPLNDKQVRLIGLVARGQAEVAIQQDPQHLQFKNADYTTCEPNDDSWRLQARDIKINKVTGRGEARHVQLYAHDVPIFYLPYFNFPIDNRRKTGFLFPIAGYTNTSGVQFGVPFYWNIAPNYDLTLTPTLYSQRGVLFDALFRYLTPSSVGILEGSFIPQDHAFRSFINNAEEDFPFQPGLPSLLDASTNRYLWHIEDQTRLSPHWRAGFNYTSVSDDYYFQDFSEIPSLLGATQLLRSAQIQYLDQHWQFSTTVQSYHTLHPVNRQPVNNIYSMLPGVELIGNYPNGLAGINWHLWSQAVYFTRNLNPNEVTSPVNTGRLAIVPGLSIPFRKTWGYLTPAAQIDTLNYSMQNQLPDLPSNVGRTIPILNVDSGLYFDRIYNLGGTDYQHTLEPRLFYLYVPFKDQNDVPGFDASYIPFSFAQLFRTNRFGGHDRIADANQASLAITSRLINQDTGRELVHIGIGSIFYFKDRQVTLCRIPGCTDVNTQVGAYSETEGVSPLAAEASYFLTSDWRVNGDIAYDFNDSTAVTSNAYLQFKPNDRSVLNMGYAYLRNGDIANNAPPGSSKNNLSQILISYAWPLSPRWSTQGIFGYSISRNYPQTFLFGLQYDTCCWAVRVGVGRSFSVLNEFGDPTFRNAFYIQWQLKGLGSIGTNQFSRYLRAGIPGFNDTFINNFEQMRYQ